MSPQAWHSRSTAVTRLAARTLAVMDLRRAASRRRQLATGVAILVVVVLTASACSAAHTPTPAPPLPGNPAPAGTYTPAVDRNAEFLGEDPFTTTQIDDIARNDSMFTIAKFADGFDVSKQFQDARNLMAAADAAGNPGLKVSLYYSGSFWFLVNQTAWKPYTDTFDPAWYLKDTAGTPIAFHGQGGTASKKVVGYVLNVANPAYRAWAVATVVAWMHSAPVRGITLDSSDLLVGDTVRQSIGNGTQSWNDLLCPAGAAVASDGDCAGVTAWNDGLHDLLAQMTAALAPLGDTVTFNGVAPSVLRTPDRNQELFASAPIADNESFCLGHSKSVDSTAVQWESVPADVAMMQAQARAGHDLVEITNYEDSSRAGYGDYCAGAFLMGWQPGHDYYMFHTNYTDTDAATVPEQNLALGLPTGQETDHDGLMTRQFAHGTVVVNTGGSAAATTLTSAMTQFAQGRELQDHPAGSTITLAGHSAEFFLGDTFLTHLDTT